MTSTLYQPGVVGPLYTPNVNAAIAAGQSNRRAVALPSNDLSLLLLIDVQVDFVHKDGALSVPGAIEDTQRIVNWMVERTEDGTLTAVKASLDSHVPIQIFSPLWWMDRYGNSPDPYTVIDVNSVLSGALRPRIRNEEEWSINYVERLENEAKKALMIWPYHTLIGTVGHNLVPALAEAIGYHTGVRGQQPNYIGKGTIPKTEHYSLFEPEIKVPDHEQGGLNVQVLDELPKYDRIFVAGQAKSHCVLESVTSMMRYFKNRPEVIEKFRFMMDCSSSVVHPDIDFDTMANEAFAEFERQGARLVTTQNWDQ